MNWYRIAQTRSLLRELESFKPHMAESAQVIYNLWDQDDGIDEEYGSGGICDQISQIISDVIVGNIDNVDIIPGGQDGDDHAWIFVKRGREAFSVDIPPGYYESGGGYRWEKIPGVIFTPDMIEIFPVNVSDLEDWEDEW